MEYHIGKVEADFGGRIDIMIKDDSNNVIMIENRIRLAPSGTSGLLKKAKQIRNLTQGSNSLVEFNLYDQKLGYLVCLVHEEMIVIRTFLFLTNDGIPEREKVG